MNDKLFRQKSINRVSSPEQLNDYIKVSSPGIWGVLIAVVILLLGVCVWGVLGRLETTVPAVVISQEGEIICCYDTDVEDQIEVGMFVRVNHEKLRIEYVSSSLERLPEDMTIADHEAGQSVYTAGLDGELPDGVYEAEIVVESITPVSFLWN